MGIAHVAESLSARLARVSSWLAGIAAATMIGSLLLGVFFRYVMQSALSWSGEWALLAFTWTVFVMASVGVREGFHVRISALDDFLSPGGRRLLHRALLLSIAVFCLLLLYIGWQFMDFSAQLRSPAIGYPMWLRNAAMPVTGALGFVHALARLLGNGELDGGGAGDGA